MRTGPRRRAEYKALDNQAAAGMVDQRRSPGGPPGLLGLGSGVDLDQDGQACLCGAGCGEGVSQFRRSSVSMPTGRQRRRPVRLQRPDEAELKARDPARRSLQRPGLLPGFRRDALPAASSALGLDTAVRVTRCPRPGRRRDKRRRCAAGPNGRRRRWTGNRFRRGVMNRADAELLWCRQRPRTGRRQSQPCVRSGRTGPGAAAVLHRPGPDAAALGDGGAVAGRLGRGVPAFRSGRARRRRCAAGGHAAAGGGC
jgi:hypothetical protein